MSARPFYRTVYHCNDWVMSDAFRPTPGWGRRSFTASVADLGGMSEDDLIRAAKEAAPKGYRLTFLSLFPIEGPEIIIWSTPPDPRFANQVDRATTSGKGATDV